MKTRVVALSSLFGLGLGMMSSPSLVQSQVIEPTHPIKTPQDARTHELDDLRSATAAVGGVPLPDLSDYLLPGSGSKRKLEQLGKLLYWDTAVGSDGMSCASCHFHAGVDNRSKSQLSPGLLRVLNDRQGDIRGYHDAMAKPDGNFELRGAGVAIRKSDFPLIRNIESSGNTNALNEVNGIVEMGPGNVNEAVGSIGVIHKKFERVRKQQTADQCSPLADGVFHSATGANVRRVPPRNTPTTINAVFNAFNFWDGRANHYFNGVNPFGVQDPAASVFVNDGGTIRSVQIKLENSSLASQAVGPPNSDFEMACGDAAAGNARTWFEIGKKLLRKDKNGFILPAMLTQAIHPEDSLIGEFALNGNGSSTNYREMIEATFQPKWWRSGGKRIVIPSVDVEDRLASQSAQFTYPTPLVADATPAEAADEAVTEEASPVEDDIALSEVNAQAAPAPRFSLMEANFSLFFGLAVQAYEATLVADDSPFDQWMRGDGSFVPGFGARELKGLNVFTDAGKCINCHGGPELTNASVRNFQKGKNLIEPMIMGDNNSAIYDNGFYNIGASPTTDDIGRGGKGPLGQPLSSSRQLLFKQVLSENVPHEIIGENHVPAVSEPDEGSLVVCDDVNGNGVCDNGELLNGNFQRVAVDGAFKTSGLRNIELQGPYFHHGTHSTLAQAVELYDNGGNFCKFNLPDLDPDITGLGLSTAEKKNLVRFLVSLTDERVRFKQAPFDHPGLAIPTNGKANRYTALAPVGASGADAPLTPFMNLNPLALGNMPVDVVCSPNG